MADGNPTFDSASPTFLCLASYEKGQRTLEDLKRLGCQVYLLTSLSLKDKAFWPAGLDDIFYMPDQDHAWNLDDMVKGVSYLARTIRIDRIMALDDFDVEKAALLREHLRIPGMGETVTRFFRDKLAMRIKAASGGYRVPEFTATFNYREITEFLQRVPGPWVLKPRFQAGAIGINKFDDAAELWERIHSLGDEQSYYVLERFVPGNIYHVDSLWSGGKMLYANASAYGTPPLELTTGGGIFTTSILEYGSEAEGQLLSMNEQVLQSFGFRDGVSHTEFIRAHSDRSFYFLETSARVGGAHIADLIEQASGLNLWSEWAKLEVTIAQGKKYDLPPTRRDYAGLLVSLARQEWPDTSAFTDPELVWRLHRQNHIGFIVKSSQQERVAQLLASYTDRVMADFQASAPTPVKVSE